MCASLRSLMSSALGAILEKKIARVVKYGFGRREPCSYATSGLPFLVAMNLTPFERSAEALLTQYFDDVFVLMLLRFRVFLLSSATTKLLWNKSSKCLGLSATAVTVSESKSSPPPPLLPNSTCLKNCIASFFKQFLDSSSLDSLVSIAYTWTRMKKGT
nr:hypothetical protein Iba_scaffold62141CG0010 [Ipomoea batatas]GMC76918.1 hypothetical protein Iba_scaffold62406CG0010 [Ipomoea batatas]GMC94127.1 hypothetical protein Iba_scaffold37435CG0030 [Ipomoea batatas]GMD73128.1 hypothetical protein Iba_scaffold50788CG0010 [Ipomoea batatas]GME02373.1 hypothetical protein Iba_contig4687CG0010 [Ipomoea batatas]